MPRGWYAISTSSLIREYLRIKGSAYPYQTWKFLYKLFPSYFTPEIHPIVKNQMALFRKTYLPPTYDSTRKMLYILRQLELIYEAHRDFTSSFREAKPRIYYGLIRERIQDPRWRDPTKAYYKPQEFEQTARLVVHRELKPAEVEQIETFVRDNDL